MKKVLFLITGVIVVGYSYSQTSPQENKEIQDRQRKADAGKADVIIAKRKSIFDSATLHADTSRGNETRNVQAGTNRKHAGTRSKNSSRSNGQKKKVD